MKSIRRNQSFSVIFQKASYLLLVAAFLSALLAVQPASAAMHQIYVTNVTDTSFAVSWTTDETDVSGYVEYGLTSSLGTQVYDVVVGSTHYVEITGLNPATEYYYQVNGDGATLSTITTGPTIGSAPAATIVGTVLQSNGTTPAPYAIVYIRLVDVDGSPSPGVSQWRSVRADDAGGYIINLGGTRTENLASVFVTTVDTDQVELLGQGGTLGTGQEIVLVPAAVLPVNIILNGTPNAVSLASLSARSATLAWLPVGLILFATASVLFYKKFR